MGPIVVDLGTQCDLFVLLSRIEKVRHEAHHLARELALVMRGFRLPAPQMVWTRHPEQTQIRPALPRYADNRPVEPDGDHYYSLAQAAKWSGKSPQQLVNDWQCTFKGLVEGLDWETVLATARRDICALRTQGGARE